MTAFAIIATIEVDAEHIDEYEIALLAHRERCLVNEPWTLQFDVLKPKDAKNQIVLYEVYTDKAAFDAHTNGDSRNQMMEDVKHIDVKLSGIPCSLAH